ncbi:MAG: HAD family hydrolase [Ruthenibacterium sp.]
MDIFENYKPHSEYLVCVDSDGCAMDTMDIKHIECFAPQWISVFGLENRRMEATKLWLDMNLYSKTRGINRFMGLAAASEEMVKRGAVIEDVADLTKWAHTAKELSNRALEAYLAIHPSPALQKALVWSNRVNEAIAALPDDDKPFPLVEESLRSISAVADIVGVSSANGAAVNAEWQKHGLKQYTRLLCCQEAGTKADIIKKLISLGYQPQRVLMVGDAFGDKAAAESNETWFYPIFVGQEEASWHRLTAETVPHLISDTFNNLLQDTYDAEFAISLHA